MSTQNLNKVSPYLASNAPGALLARLVGPTCVVVATVVGWSIHERSQEQQRAEFTRAKIEAVNAGLAKGDKVIRFGGENYALNCTAPGSGEANAFLIRIDNKGEVVSAGAAPLLEKPVRAERCNGALSLAPAPAG